MRKAPHIESIFCYEEAFSRNLGWITEDESKILRTKKVAIAGLGGVGGLHLLTHIRLGIEKFHIADFDIFEVANFNRQIGASIPHIGQPKVQVMKAMALNINPHATIDTWDQGLNESNMVDFFSGCDLFIDGLDFFSLDIRRMAFDYCARHGITAITAAPLGLGASVYIFKPNHMTFEQYFGLEGYIYEEQLLRFYSGLSPYALHWAALVDPVHIDFQQKKGPSTTMGCEFCSAMTASQSLKILLERGPLLIAPRGIHFDAYMNKMKISCCPFGANNPLQIWQRHRLRKFLSKRIKV